MGKRNRTEQGPTVYKKACEICKKKNGGECLGREKEAKNLPLLVLDTKRMYLYRNMYAGKINKLSKKNKHLWCAEWVNYV